MRLQLLEEERAKRDFDLEKERLRQVEVDRVRKAEEIRQRIIVQQEKKEEERAEQERLEKERVEKERVEKEAAE